VVVLVFVELAAVAEDAEEAAAAAVAEPWCRIRAAVAWRSPPSLLPPPHAVSAMLHVAAAAKTRRPLREPKEDLAKLSTLK
jgi:hypothetical protein